MTNYLAIYFVPTIIMILFIISVICTITADNLPPYNLASGKMRSYYDIIKLFQHREGAAAFSVLFFILFIIEIMIIIDYNNTLVSAPKFNNEYKTVPSSSSVTLSVMPSSSSFTKEVINEHNKSLKEFEGK